MPLEADRLLSDCCSFWDSRNDPCQKSINNGSDQDTPSILNISRRSFQKSRNAKCPSFHSPSLALQILPHWRATAVTGTNKAHASTSASFQERWKGRKKGSHSLAELPPADAYMQAESSLLQMNPRFSPIAEASISHPTHFFRPPNPPRFRLTPACQLLLPHKRHRILLLSPARLPSHRRRLRRPRSWHGARRCLPGPLARGPSLSRCAKCRQGTVAPP